MKSFPSNSHAPERRWYARVHVCVWGREICLFVISIKLPKSLSLSLALVEIRLIHLEKNYIKNSTLLFNLTSKFL